MKRDGWIPPQPGKIKLAKYKILKCLEQAEKLSFEQLHQYAELENKDLVSVLGKLMQWQDIKRHKDGKKVSYSILKAGKNKLNYFKQIGYAKYWTAPWERRH